ncbi:MAG: heme b synthase [Spirochaetota bacterium]|nr:heme b synthase [Spirochaetota bacterium]
MKNLGINNLRIVFWELTKKCNLKCKHCRAEAEDFDYQGELTTEEIKDVIDNISTFANPILILTGGEPLYRSDIFDIAKYAKTKEFRLALATNGTLIDSKLAESIKNSGFERVSISIDGKDAVSHDGFRGIKGAFDESLRGVGFLKEYEVDFQFNATITNRNVDEIEGILRLSEEMGAKALHIFMLVPVGCGVQIVETDMISKEKYEEVLNWFYDRSKETKLEFKATCAPHYYRIIRQRAKEEGREITFETDGLSAMTRGCLSGTAVCFISHKGDVQACGYLPLIAGNVLETPFRDIWEKSELFTNLRDLSKLKGKCGICEYKTFCAGCRARAYSEYNDYLAEEPYCVYIPKRLRKREDGISTPSSHD